MVNGRDSFLYYIKKNLDSNDHIKYESVFQLIKEYSDLEIEIETNASNNKEILVNIRKRNIKNLIKTLSTSLFITKKQDNGIKKELTDFLNLLKEYQKNLDDEKNLNNLKNYMEIILKQRETDFIFNIIQEISEQKLMFSEAKQLADYFIRESYHQGISSHFMIDSLKLYEEDWGENYNTNDALNTLFKEVLEKTKKNDTGDIYIYIWNPSTKKEFKLENISFKKIESDITSLNIDLETTVVNLNINNTIINIAPWFKYIKSEKYENYSIFSVPFGSLPGKDFYYKVEYLNKLLKKYLTIFYENIGEKELEFIVHTTFFGTNNLGDNYNFELKYTRKNHNTKFQTDYSNFLKYYKSYKLGKYTTKSGIDELFTLLNILKDSQNNSIESRFISLWSILENISQYNEKGSIISKVEKTYYSFEKLFYLKKLLKEIWEELEILEGKIEENSKMSLENIQLISKIKSESFDYEKHVCDFNQLWTTLINTDDEKFNFLLTIQKFGLYQNISKIKLIDDNIKNLSIQFEKIEENYAIDFMRIYRYRNIIVHNSSELADLEYLTSRLEQYVYSMLSVLMHHILNNNTISIKNVIFSTNRAIENLSTLEKPQDYIAVKYYLLN